jgi:drug/metabolite transporter (DMT)-like permease
MISRKWYHMTRPSRNRLLGALIFLVGLAGVWFVYGRSGTPGVVLSVFAGAALGMGGALLLTGRPLWNPRSWWAAHQMPGSDQS